MENKNDKSDLFLERRRQLLKMGAAGMPMVLTLRASAQEAIISQLRCVITLADSFKILVDDSGAAWVGSRNIRTKRDGSYKASSLKKFKDRANFVYPEGSAPASYRPDACEECEVDDSHSHGHDDDNWYTDANGDKQSSSDLLAHLSDNNGNYAMTDYLAGSGDDDSHNHNPACDDHGHTQGNGDCGYALYEYRRGMAINPGEYVSGNGFTISGDVGLYLALSTIYADEYGGNGSWPGISCIVSVLNYLGQ